MERPPSKELTTSLSPSLCVCVWECLSSTLLANFNHTIMQCCYQLQSPCYTLGPQTLLIIQNLYIFFTKLSLFPPSLTPVNHFSTLFLSSTLFFKKDSTYRWHHFLSIWLILCTVMPSRFILLLQMTGLLPFARLNNILLLVICVYIYIYISWLPW